MAQNKRSCHVQLQPRAFRPLWPGADHGCAPGCSLGAGRYFLPAAQRMKRTDGGGRKLSLAGHLRPDGGGNRVGEVWARSGKSIGGRPEFMQNVQDGFSQACPHVRRFGDHPRDFHRRPASEPSSASAPIATPTPDAVPTLGEVESLKLGATRCRSHRRRR